jgi:hypothetical protein
MISGLFALLCFVWISQRLARWFGRRRWRAIEAFGCAVAPLVLVALISILINSPQPPNARTRLA